MKGLKGLKRTSNLSNVILLNPGLPMVHQSIPSRVVILILTKRPLVNDTVAAGVLEQRWGWESAPIFCK